jgi:hypothetical protein
MSVNYGQPVGLFQRMINLLQMTKQTEKSRQLSMPQAGFEFLITLFERMKTFHISDRTATEVGNYSTRIYINSKPTTLQTETL